MNIKLVFKLLGILAGLLGGFMLLSLPWAWPALGVRNDIPFDRAFEAAGFRALLISSAICFAVGGVFYILGRGAQGTLYRKEAMAVVGLSWVLATLLGALPFGLAATTRGPAVRLGEPDENALAVRSGFQFLSSWRELEPLDEDEYKIVKALISARPAAIGLAPVKLRELTGIENYPEVFERLKADDDWKDVLIAPGEIPAPADRVANYRIRWVRMTVADSMFESQSGFSTTGASVLAELEDPALVPHCILFWRSSTHFLGGLGIIVLFVALLGHGSAGKALMRAEMPGPTADGSSARMQHSAWRFAGIYIALTVVLAVILIVLGMTPFDALCHSFGTMATGGFSTYNASIGHFESPAIEYVIILFMILAGTNFTLLYFMILRQPGKLLADVEWRTYILIILIVTGIIVALGIVSADRGFESAESGFRIGLFQAVSILTTTGYGTADFDTWNQLARLMLLLLMFVGGCAGSTGGGMKVIRHVLFGKIFFIETEKAFRPRVVRPLRISGQTVDESLKYSIAVYFGMILTLFVFGWLFVVAIESDNTWGERRVDEKLIDSGSAVVSMLNNIGPGLGTVGPTSNYGHFCGCVKLFFVLLMMLGRLEILPILVLFSPSFWRES